MSRDQEDIAGVYKRLRFAGVKIVTLSEGEVSELHIGLKGTMGALYLKDLADKTRRGLRGRVEAGKSGGGNSYGYDVVLQLRRDGRTRCAAIAAINEAQAAIVRRIFNDYAAGKSPQAIAQALNKRGVPGPSGRGLGAVDDQRQLAARHRHPQQRALYRQAGLEPAALHQGPRHRKARLAPQPGVRTGSSRTCRSCGSSIRRCGTG